MQHVYCAELSNVWKYWINKICALLYYTGESYLLAFSIHQKGLSMTNICKYVQQITCYNAIRSAFPFLYHTGSNLKYPYYSCDGKPEFFALLQSSEILLTSWFENVIICVINSWSDSLMNRKFQSFVQTFGSVNCPTELNTTGYARMVLRMTHSARVSWIRPIAGVIYFRESFGNAYPRSISEPCGLWWGELMKYELDWWI